MSQPLIHAGWAIHADTWGPAMRRALRSVEPREGVRENPIRNWHVSHRRMINGVRWLLLDMVYQRGRAVYLGQEQGLHDILRTILGPSPNTKRVYAFASDGRRLKGTTINKNFWKKLHRPKRDAQGKEVYHTSWPAGAPMPGGQVHISGWPAYVDVEED